MNRLPISMTKLAIGPWTGLEFFSSNEMRIT